MQSIEGSWLGHMVPGLTHRPMSSFDGDGHHDWCRSACNGVAWGADIAEMEWKHAISSSLQAGAGTEEP
jgi:hypothetical protein